MDPASIDLAPNLTMGTLKRWAPLLALPLLAALALGFWVSTRGPRAGDGRERGPAAEGRGATGADGAALGSPLGWPEVALEGSLPALRSQPGEPAAATTLATAVELEGAEQVRLFGRVIDGTGAPLAGVELELAAEAGWGALGAGTPLEPDGRLFGHRRTSDEAGRFEFEVAPPLQRCWLKLDAGPLWTALSIDFKADPDRSFLPPGARNPDAGLRPGPRDLGDLVLQPAGIVAGQVVDNGGRPIAGANVTLRRADGRFFGVQCWSSEQGLFVLEHAPAGEFLVKAFAPGHLPSSGQALTIMAGATTQGLRLELEPGPRLFGRVVTEDGHGVPGLDLELRPAAGGFSSAFESGPEGSFDLGLRSLGAHRVKLHSRGWELLGPEQFELPVQAGQGLEIRVRPWPLTRFLVRDRRSGAPLERFGLVVRPLSDLFDSAPLPGGQSAAALETHPGGIVSLPARNAQDYYLAFAPDHQWVLAKVAWSASGTADCEVLLDPRGALLGRVVAGDRGLADVPWKLESEVTDMLGMQPFEGRSDASGRFEIRGHFGGPFRLSLNAGAWPNRILPHVEIQEAADLDLGQLSLGGPGRLEVQVLMPPGEPLEGIEVRAEGPDGQLRCRTDRSGLARFEGLSAATWQVGSPGTERVGDSARQRVEVEAGRTAQARIDLSARALCQLELDFDFPGARPERLLFSLVPALEQPAVDFGGPKPLSFEPKEIDSTGRWSGAVLPSGPARIQIHTEPGIRVQMPQPLLELSPGGLVRARVRVETGSLELQLPESFAWPQEAGLELTFEALEGAPFCFKTYGSLPPKRSLPGFRAPLEAGPDGLRCPAAPTGRFRLTLAFKRDGAFDPESLEPLPLEIAPGISQLSGLATIRPGETARVPLAP